MKTSEEDISKRTPHCLQCGKEMSYGRPDRKFCSPKCKNRYHNHSHIGPRLMKMRIQHSLEKNYRILNIFIDSGVAAVPMPTLMVMGFNPMYSTGLIRNGKTLVYMCFDITYRMSASRIFDLSVTNEPNV